VSTQNVVSVVLSKRSQEEEEAAFIGERTNIEAFELLLINREIFFSKLIG